MTFIEFTQTEGQTKTTRTYFLNVDHIISADYYEPEKLLQIRHGENARPSSHSIQGDEAVAALKVIRDHK